MPECYAHRENATLGHSQRGFTDNKEQMCMLGYVRGWQASSKERDLLTKHPSRHLYLGQASEK